MNNQLAWVKKMIQSFLYADFLILDASVSPIENLSSKIVISFIEPVDEKYRNTLKILVEGFTKENGCFLRDFELKRDSLSMRIFVKRPNGPISNKDPLIKQIKTNKKSKKEQL